MKNSILSLSFAFVFFNMGFSQKVATENIPAPVLTTFKAMFSIAEKTSWELQYENYEADFKVGKTEFSAVFDKDGKWLETQTYMKPSELPKPVKDMLIKEFGELSGYKIEEAEKIETFDKGIQYELKIEKGEIDYEMTFSEAGALIRKEELKEKDKDKN